MAEAAVHKTEKSPIRLQEGESVIQIVRQHPWFLISKLVLAALIFIGFVILLNLASRQGGIFSNSWAPWVLLIGLVITLAAGFSRWYAYRNNLWAITNQRLIDSMKSAPWRQTLSTADLVNVQDVNAVVSGIAASIFKFGDINVQTSSNSRGLVINGVRDPEQVLSAVDKARDAARREQFRSIGAAIGQGQN